MAGTTTGPQLRASGQLGAEVVVTMSDGRELWGRVPTFHPRLQRFMLRHPSQPPQDIAVEDVRTIAFQRSAEPRRGGYSPNARLVTVRMRDGAMQQGVAENYGGGRTGMFLVPIANTAVDRIYIPVTAIRDVIAVQRLGDVIPNTKMITTELIERAAKAQSALEPPLAAPDPVPQPEPTPATRANPAPQPAAAASAPRAAPQKPATGAAEPAPSPKRKGMPIGQILVEQGYVSAGELEEALACQQGRRDKKLGEVLIELGYTSYKTIAIALALQYNAPFMNLSGHELDPSLRDLLKKEEAMDAQMLPLRLEGRVLYVALADPLRIEFRETLERRSGATVSDVICTPQDIVRMIELLYPEEQQQAGGRSALSSAAAALSVPARPGSG
jgi:hypothetical protein